MSTSTPTLHDLYAPVQGEMEAARSRFERELISELPWVNQLCERVARYRGKMLRPALLLLGGKACGSLTDEHVTLAAVVEMVHVATLVHDDVLDESDLRRATATINHTDGNETAVLLGDYLISHAFHLCSSLRTPTASRRIGAAANTVCEGEMMQIHHRGNAFLTESEYFDIVRRKTAALTEVCCELGAVYAGADETVVAGMKRFGLSVGTAFQIVDDVLDLVGSASEMGKPAGNDADLGKPTLPTIHCLANADSLTRARLTAFLTGSETPTNGEISRWVEQSGSVAYAMSTAHKFVESALDDLAALSPSAARSSLEALTEFITHRRK